MRKSTFLDSFIFSYRYQKKKKYYDTPIYIYPFSNIKKNLKRLVPLQTASQLTIMGRKFPALRIYRQIKKPQISKMHIQTHKLDKLHLKALERIIFCLDMTNEK